jgi:dipeptidyl aminopeptidase/acylaminoacyl peptidase
MFFALESRRLLASAALCLLPFHVVACSSSGSAEAGSLAALAESAAAPAVEPPPPSAPADALTLKQIADLRAVGAAAISPDARWVAFTRSTPRKPGIDDDGTPWAELWLLERATGKERAFVSGKVNVGGVDWLPDSSAVTFLAKRGDDKASSLYVLPIDGGEARRALGSSEAIGSYSLSPDGKRVAYVATEPDSAGLKKAREKGFTQEIYEEDWRYNRVWIGTLYDEAAKPKKLSLVGHAHAVRWSPVDERLLVSIAPTPSVDDEYMEQRVIVVDAAKDEIVARVENSGKLGATAWSPDGARIALVSAADKNDPSAGRLMVVSSAGGKPTELLSGTAGDCAGYAWQSPTSLLATMSRGVWTTLERIELESAGGASTSTVLVPVGGPILGGMSLADDGMSAAFVANSAQHPPELYTMSHGDAGPTRRTNSNPWLDKLRLSKQELVTYKARDGVMIDGLLVRPLDEQAGRRYPLVLYVHGGPEAHHSNGWLSNYGDPAQTLAANGYFVMHTNYRGSTGRGVAFSKLSQGDPAGREFEDLIDAVDWLVAQGWVDTTKVGVTGGSYGGYATAWLSTRYSGRFAAGVMFVGISDKLSKVGTTDIPNEEYYVHALHRPWEKWQFLLERSPIHEAGNCRTPLLILHGKDDPRVNPGQSREMYRHLKLRSKAPVRLVLYPGEGHGNRKAAARYDYSLRLVQWFDHYLRGAGGEPPAWELDYGIEAKGTDGKADAKAEAVKAPAR